MVIERTAIFFFLKDNANIIEHQGKGQERQGLTFDCSRHLLLHFPCWVHHLLVLLYAFSLVPNRSAFQSLLSGSWNL